MRQKNVKFVSPKKIITIINSCETNRQLKTSLRIIDNYIENTSRNGLNNHQDLRNRLMKEYNQKKFQLNMIKMFITRNEKEYRNELVRETA